MIATDVRSWLAEDLGDGDVTSEAVLDPGQRCAAVVLLKEPGVICGLALCETVFRELDAEVSLVRFCEDGDRLDPGEVARVEGSAHAILAAERVALNLLGRLSGIATLTRRYVDAVAGTQVTILDTRKTTPGLRALEKEAVRAGGASNHRFGLYDATLLKENHLRLAGGIEPAIRRTRRAGLPVEVECETIVEVTAALAAGADRILLDNMTPAQIRSAVELAAGAVELEASGGITLATVREVAETGVDFISIGALTHSVPTLDVSLEVLS